MILHSLKLKNIRSYVDETICFPQGSLLLSGDIGAGKSTILFAIEFALFGLMRGDIEGEALLRNGTQKGTVELECELAGKNIVIRRNLKRIGKSSGRSVKQEAGYIIIDNKKTDLTPVELKSRILQLLGYPDSLLAKSKIPLYRYTVYTPQEAMKQIIFESPDARVDTIRKIFGIDKYKRITQNAEILARKMREHIRIMKAKTEDLRQKELDMNKLKTERGFVDEKIREEEGSLKKIDCRILDNEKNLKVLSEKEDAYKKDSQALEILLAKENEKSVRMAHDSADVKLLAEECKTFMRNVNYDLKIIDTSDIETCIEQVNNKITELKTMLATHDEKIKSSQKETAELNIDLKRKTAILRKIREELKDKSELQKIICDKNQIAAKFEECEREILDAASENKALKLRAEHDKKAFSVLSQLTLCPTCMQDVDESHKDKIGKELKKNIGEIQSAIDNNMKILKENETRIADLRMKLNNIVSAEKDYAVLMKQEDEMCRLQEDINLIQSKLIHIKNIASIDISSELRALEEYGLEKKQLLEKLKVLQNKNILAKECEFKKRLIEEKNRRITYLETVISQTKSELQELSKEKDVILLRMKENDAAADLAVQKRRELENLRLLKNNKNITIAELKKEQETINEFLNKMEGEIAKKRRVLKESEALSKKENWLSTGFISIVKAVEKSVMTALHLQFNEIFREWVCLLLDDDLLTLRIDNEFTPLVVQNDEPIDIAHLSGGEKTACALAYRLALNHVINNFVTTIKTKDILILDEPTDGFSAEQLDKVREVLQELHVKQLLIVSHELKVESFVDHIIRIAKFNHKSMVIMA